MAKKKTEEKEIRHAGDPNVMGLRGAVVEQPITATLDENYMPYAMSVIVSRAIPEIDGFKPSHRKLLYTMYKMGLLNGNRTKSANIVGQTMKLNPHGDAAIYETMVRLTRGNEALLMPFVDSKGNFGKVYSRDMAYAAPRYTEAKLDAFCAELFRDIDTDAVDFVDNYDGEMKEPTLLPTTYPNILVSANTGIAVGMASNFCGFNLAEVCRTTIELIKNPEHDILSTLPAPDFTTGGELIYDEAEMRAIYRTGRGSFKVRAKWAYNKKDNLIEITEIPYTTTIEAIIDKIAELVKNGKVREIADVRDETDLSGLKIAIDLKRGTDPEKLMAKLMKMTTLQDSFSCNFNVLIAGMPRVLGVAELLDEDAGIDDKHVGILCAAEIYVDKVGNRNAQHHGPQPFLQSSAGHEETAEESAEGETENAYSAVDETNLLGGKAETAILYAVEHEGVDNLDKLSLGKTEEQHEEQGGDDLRFAEENLQGADKLAQLRTYIWFYGGMNVFDLRKGETVVEVHAKEKDCHDKERGGPGKRYIAGNAVST